MAVNLLSRSRGFQANKERLAAAFDGRSLVFPSCDSGNAIAFATAGDAVDVSCETLAQRAQHGVKQIDHGVHIAQRRVGTALGQAVILAQGLQLAIASGHGVKQPPRQFQRTKTALTNGRHAHGLCCLPL